MNSELQHMGINLAEAIRSFPQRSDSWFDLAVELVIDLKLHIESEELFISQYCERNKIGDRSNPNRDLLLRMKEIVEGVVSSERRSLESFESACARIAKALEATHLEPYADANKNGATLTWAVITGIDLAYSRDNLTAQLTVRGPLNSLRLNEVGVYLKPLETPLRLCSKESEFELVLSSRRFNSQLSSLSFYWKQPQQELPTVVGIKRPIGDSGPRSLRSGHSAVVHAAFGEEWAIQLASDTEQDVPTYECDVSIGAVSFTGVNFVNEGEKSPILLEAGYGTSFIVTYSQRYDDLFLDMVEESVKTAVSNDCDVLVFPELTISPSALNAISRTLRGLSERGRLKLVVAGSTYEPSDSGSAGDNVCHIFDARGVEIGTHFKRVPFEMNLGGSKLVEALEHPGLHTTIVDVEGVGRVVIGICKDLAANDEYVTRFVTDFEADLVVLPAMSPSLIRGFADAARNLATRHLAVTVVCNQCGARMTSADKVETAEYGRVVVPSKGEGANRKQASFTELGLCRSPGCLASCRAAYAKGTPLCCFKKVSIVSSSEVEGFILTEQAIRI